MNNDMSMVELNDEQLEMVAGGVGYQGHGVNVEVNTNIAVPINVNVSPTINVALWSPGAQQSGSNVNQQNFSWQNIK
jgi:hypothetical protein